MKTYFFFDIDGTLTQPLTADVPDSTREALRLLRKHGHFIAIATGRIQADAMSVAHELDIHSAVSDGGECVTLDDEIQYHRGLDKPSCIEMVHHLDPEQHPWAAAVRNEKVAYATTPHYLDKVEQLYYKLEIQPHFDIKEADCIHKIFVATHTLEGLDLYGLPHCWLRAGTLLIEPTSKEKGIQYIMKKYDLTDSQIVVFGDGTNDQSMFRPEWMSVAMGNAKDVLKKRAKYITTRADEDGIYNACRHFGWI